MAEAYRTCSIEGCNNKHKAKGYCSTHYGVATAKATCGVGGCQNLGTQKFGYCKSHYMKWWRANRKEKCSCADCENIVDSRGLCRKHYARWRTHGDTETVKVGGVKAKPFKAFCVDKKCTKCGETKSYTEFYKRYNNVHKKHYLDSACKPCINTETTERSRNNKSRQDYQRKYRLKNKERINAQIKSWVDENRERVRALSNAGYRSNCEKRKRKAAEWAKNNKALTRHYSAKNRADRLLRSVQWADDCEIQRIYALRQTMSEYFQTDLHVDHIIPLKGRKVSGLHVHNNLQILTAEQNLSKGNKFKCK